jgi:uncharacterized protein with HEPN domain
MKDDRVYLVYIGECIERIEQYTASGREAFMRQPMAQDAVLRNLHTLSESAQRISDELKKQHPEVLWRSIIAFRQVVVHNYLEIDLDQIWDIVERDLPSLKTQIASILATLPDE